MTKIKDREKLTKAVIIQTERLIEAEYPSTKPKSKFTNEQREMSTIISRISGCNKPDVKKLIELVIGSKLPELKDTSPDSIILPTLSAVVPLSNPNSHSYSIGKVAICTRGSNQCVMQDGRVGNSITRRKSAIRPATKSEIRKFISKLHDDSVNKIMREHCIII